jgi:hypothetical protein
VLNDEKFISFGTCPYYATIHQMSVNIAMPRVDGGGNFQAAELLPPQPARRPVVAPSFFFSQSGISFPACFKAVGIQEDSVKP